ncbi:shugoshin 1 isoform X1 [Nelusetta ayraudi]|uniref:shugoshin 1 isoform X1 n=1 Tax=Nelusetta ayraudi TaxID=303726 RepID=UPI003F6ECFAA
MMKSACRKKAVQKNLENIMAKMKEKRNKLASGAAPGRARCPGIIRSAVTQTSHTIQKGLQVNNKALAEALQAEKENVRQAKAVILQLQHQQQLLLQHILLLRRKLKEQQQESEEACSAPQPEYAEDVTQPKRLVAPERRRRGGGSCVYQPAKCVVSPVRAAAESPEQNLTSSPADLVALPPTVTVRRRLTDRRSSRRRSDRIQEMGRTSELDPVPASPIGRDPNPAAPVAEEEVRHSTPEATPPRKPQQRAGRKPTSQQPRGKPEPPARKQERGRRPEVGPLKKPWENSKPRARSKSRDCSATRARAAPAAQGAHKANTSLGFNDNFDFDCEESVHVTPFRNKAEENPAGAAGQQGAETAASKRKESLSPPSSPSSQSEDSLYVPHKNWRRRSSAGQTKVVATRRGRPSRGVREKENTSKEESSPKAEEPEAPEAAVCHSPGPARLEESYHELPSAASADQDRLCSMSPLVDGEMMSIDDVLSSFGGVESPSRVSFTLRRPLRRAKSCKRRAHGVRPAGRRGLSLCEVTNLSPSAHRSLSGEDARCSTPLQARKRRCTTKVDYKEPTLNKKLRRGDKFTDLQFLSSPIFKQTPGRKNSFQKYNESFVGCQH